MYKRYERYKDSEIEWIGEVPQHWELNKLKRQVTCLDGKRVPLSSEVRSNMQGEYPYWGANCVIDYVNDWLFDGDIILLGEDGAPFFDWLKPVAFYSNNKIWANNHVHVLKPNGKMDAKLITYFLNIVDYKNYIKGSTRDKLTQSEMNKIPIPIIPMYEQNLIIEHLDHKTSEIGSLIADKEKLIEKLEEYKQYIIIEAVTKGLTPDVKMKDSGIEWIGEIPEHWEIKRLKHLVRLVNIKTDNEDLPYVGLEHVESWTGKYIRPVNPSQPDNEANLFEPNDVLFGKLRPYLAKVLLPDFIGRCTSELLVLRGVNIIPGFLFYVALSKHFINTVDSSTYGAKMPRASWQFISNLPQVIPPVDEQKSIYIFLNNKIDSIDSIIKDNRKHIDVLKSYRQALIYEAVTGKIDVRDYEPQRSEKLA